MLDERRWTWLLAGLIAIGGGLSLWPKLHVAFTPLKLEVHTLVRPDARISLNRASLGELLTLPGVGPTLARRIVAHRPYVSVEELKRVPGIGPKLWAKLKDRVRP